MTPQDGDLGAIFGWGFAPYTGGPFSAIDTIGPAKVIETLDRLTAVEGERFAPPQQLRDMAASGGFIMNRRPRKPLNAVLPQPQERRR